MKHFALFKNGKYKEYKSDSKIFSHIDDIKFVFVDIETRLKGPVYSYVAARGLEPVPFDTSISFKLSYEPVDCPCSKETTLSSSIYASSLGSNFCIYPLVTEMYQFNNFKRKYDIDDDYINIESIRIDNKGNHIEIIPDEISNRDMESIFKKTRLFTNGALISKHEIVVLKNNDEWYIDTKIPSSFKCIFYKVTNQTFYRITNKEYLYLKLIRFFRLTIFIPEEDENLDFDDIDNSPYVTLYASNIFDILEICLFQPQLMSLDKALYDEKISIKIELGTDINNYVLNISSKECNSGFCLYEILYKLLAL